MAVFFKVIHRFKALVGFSYRDPQTYPKIPAAAAAAKSLQSCPTLCDPIDGSPPGSPVPGILQARTLEWVAISFSKAWKWKVKVKLLNRVRLLATPWTAAHQAPPSMGFSRQESWSGLPLPSLPNIPGEPQLSEEWVGGPTLPSFKSYFKAVMQRVLYKHKDRHVKGLEPRVQK